MKLFVLVAALLGSGLFAIAAETQITGFGTSQKNPFSLTDDLQGSWKGQGSLSTTALLLSNVSNVANGSNGIFSNLTIDGRTPVLIGTAPVRLTLTAALTSPVPGVDRFSISLFDSGNNELDYIFNWSSFQPGGSTVTATLAGSSGVFNGTVRSWGLGLFDLTGVAPATVSANFFDLGVVPVPEPSVSGLVLAAAVALLGSRRRGRLVPARLTRSRG